MGQWDGQPQASGDSRADADHWFLASLFPFHRKRHSFMHSNIYWATTVWHVLFLAYRKPIPGLHGASSLSWKETMNRMINNMLRKEAAMNIEAGINSDPCSLSLFHYVTSNHWVPSKCSGLCEMTCKRKNSKSWHLPSTGETRRNPVSYRAQWQRLRGIYQCTSHEWSHFIFSKTLSNGSYHSHFRDDKTET